MGNPSFEPSTPAGKALYRSIVVLAGLAVAAVAAFVLLRHAPQKTPATHELDRTIAVLPFENASGDPKQAYLSDGFAAHLIGSLTRVHDLKVIGRNSSFQFRNGNADEKTIGTRLGATCLVEGSVRRNEQRVLISARLINAVDGSTVWSQAYDREFNDVFSVQIDIAHAVAAALHAGLPGDAALTPSRPASGNVRAYEALLRGEFSFRLATEAGYRDAIARYDEAIGLDPNYAAAYAARALAWENLGAEHLGADALKDAFARTEESARKALELDPTLVTAHIALGLVEQDAKSDFAAAETQFRRAAELEPSDALASASLAVLIGSTGRLPEAVELTHRALPLDPLRAGMYNFLSQILVPLHRYEEAEQSIRKAMELQPNSDIYYTEFALIEFFRGNADAALSAANKENEGFWREYTLALLYAMQDNRSAADESLQRLIDRYADIGPFQIADVYAARKEADAAFKWLDRAFENHDAGITQLLYSPFLLAYRNDPRFAAFCRKAGLPSP